MKASLVVEVEHSHGMAEEDVGSTVGVVMEVHSELEM